MKRCPQCRRDYYDDSLLYCLDDGTQLLEGPASDGHISDVSETAILYTGQDKEAPTRAQVLPTSTGDRDSGADSEQTAKLAGRVYWLTAVLALGLLAVAGFVGLKIFRAAAMGKIGSIAVMPFANDSGNSDLDYLSDGMTETLISSLSKVPALNVKPRSMVSRYKGKEVDPKGVGNELGVESILTGRVVSRGPDLSLFAELIDVASTKVIWSQRYDRKLADLVSLQSEIARDVSARINADLTTAEATKVARNPTDNPEAYRLCLLANSLAARRKVNDLRTALDYYDRAVALDPNYALAYVGIATSHVFMTIYAGEPGEVELPKARVAAAKAIEIDPNLPEAHNILGGVEIYLNHDWAANERENARALEINPNFANSYRHNGIRYGWNGEFDKAISAFRHTLELDPLSVVAYTNLAWCYRFAGRLDESEAAMKSAQQIDPSFWFIEYTAFLNARARKDYAAAAEHLARAQELRDESQAAKFIRDAFAKGGWTALLRDCLAQPEQSKVWDYYLASFALELGDKERAFKLLNSAIEKYDQFTFFIKIDPEMDGIRHDPRYPQLLKKSNVIGNETLP